MKNVLFKISVGGEHVPVSSDINSVIELAEHDGIASITIDTKIKHPGIVAIGSDEDNPVIELDLNSPDDGDNSEITILGYRDWSVWNAQSGKYRIDITLIRNDILSGG